MTHPVVADWTNALGGAAVVALGLFVLTVRPRTAASSSFAVFAIGFGGHFLAGNFAAALHAPRSTLLSAVTFLAWGAGVTVMAWTFPRSVAAEERGAFSLAALVTLVLTASGMWSFVGVFGVAPESVVAMLMFSMIAEAVLIGYLVLLVLRYRRSDDPDFRRQAALTAAAITMYVGYIGGFGRAAADGALAASGSNLLHAVFRLALLMGLAALWLASTRGLSARTARNMAWLTLAMPLAGLLMYAGGRIEGGHGLTRLAMAAILAYAILRHQLLGLDVKVRWGISRSTIAAAFIAAFFIASEAAQQFLGDTIGSTYAGIAAAGALVFAIAPLQRVAERLAEKAVPVGPSSPTHLDETTRRREEAYRIAVGLALRDGTLGRDEERQLLRLAEELGIPAGRAGEIHAEVEREQEVEPWP